GRRDRHASRHVRLLRRIRLRGRPSLDPDGRRVPRTADQAGRRGPRRRRRIRTTHDREWRSTAPSALIADRIVALLLGDRPSLLLGVARMAVGDGVTARALLRRRWIIPVDDRLLALDLVEILFLGLHEFAARVRCCAEELIELEVDRARVAVLRVLDEEDHEERYYGGRRVHVELPLRREPEKRPCQKPDPYDENGREERPGRANPLRHSAREARER